MNLQPPPIQLPTPAVLEATLRHRLIQYNAIRWVASTGSTNTDLLHDLKQASATPLTPCLLGSHEQTQGKGRAGRQWANQGGHHLMFSCGFTTSLDANLLPAVAPYAGLSACLALRRLLPEPLQSQLTLKWPNDLEWQGSKLAGILVEAARVPPYHNAANRFVVIGIGINLAGATTLGKVLGRRIADWQAIEQQARQAGEERCVAGADDLVTGIANQWVDMMQEINHDGLRNLATAYQQVDGLFNRKVNIMDNEQLLVSGSAKGLDARGALVVEDAQHTRHAIVVGEVSVRKS